MDKIFTWLFLINGAFVPIVIILGIMGYNVQLASYGLDTGEALSPLEIIIITIFIVKGITAFGLLKEKYWAIKLGIADAIIGISICTLVMLYPILNSEVKFSLRLELVALIPYLLKLSKVKIAWETFGKR